MPNCDDSITKNTLVEMGWRERKVPNERLYNTIYDPSETNNLAGQPETMSTLKHMRVRLDRWMASTGDPLVDHDVVPPDKGMLNDPSDLSPSRDPRFPI